ncbi:hypothetical protein [Actinacidiphila reveromycinica]|nr:hypothetical protein [Streptomyces sp. SN-593]
MAIRDQAAVLWQAWIGDLPRTVADRVRLMGGAARAADAVGVSPGTVRRWVRDERQATTTVTGAIKTHGGVDEAARAAGVTPRTIRAWARQEARGRVPGVRQAKHIAKLTAAAADKRVSDQPTGNAAKLARAVLSSPTARQSAMNGRRAARISNSGAHVAIRAKVTVDTGKRKDERWRDISVNFSNDAMGPATDAFLAGDNTGTLDALNNLFGERYAPGTGWKFTEIRSMEIKGFGGPGSTF